METVQLRPFSPADRDWIVHQHDLLYTRDEGFDATFAPLVSEIVEGFIRDHDPACERGWIAERDGQRLGCIFCARLSADTAKLRLFLVLPEARGTGLGRRLLETCMDFARANGYRRMQLWTHESHRAACGLYRKVGWQLTGAKPVRSFGCDLIEQSWQIDLV